MAQSLFGGATSYEEQSLNDIKTDITKWTYYTKKMQEEMNQRLANAEESGFWSKVGFDFKCTISATIFYFQTILDDMDIILTSIEQNCITTREVNLLRKIGQKSIEYNTKDYPQSFKGENYRWHDYGNPDFSNVEDMYAHGRDYFVTLQDAANAAYRLEDYMNNRNIVNNNMNVSGNISNSQIQQGTNNSSQTLEISNEFDYIKALEILTQIQQYSVNDLFSQEFGDKTDELRRVIDEAIKDAQSKTNSGKLKESLAHIKSFVANVSSGIIASGIFQLLQNGFPTL